MWSSFKIISLIIGAAFSLFAGIIGNELSPEFGYYIRRILQGGKRPAHRPPAKKHWTVKLAFWILSVLSITFIAITALDQPPSIIASFFDSQEDLSSPTHLPNVTKTPPIITLAIYREYSASTIPLLPTVTTGDKTNQYSIEDINDSERISLPTGNTVGILVENQDDFGTVLIENELPFRLIKYSRINSEINVFFPQTGGAGYYRNFVLILSPDKLGEVRAKFDVEGKEWLEPDQEELKLPLDNNSKVIPDYFSLVPTETEVFIIEVRFTSPGVYTFQAGIEYIWGDARQIAWLDQEFVAIVPSEMIVWMGMGDSSGNLENAGTCIWSNPLRPGVHAYDCPW